MWAVLYYVTPTTISVALALLFIFALLLASVAKNSSDHRPRHIRKVLAAATVSYIIILVMPPSGDIQTSTSRIVHWNPLHFMDELASEETVEESFSQFLTDGSMVHYSPDELSSQEREVVQETNPADFFAYGDTETGVTVVDAEGNPATPPQEQLVTSEISKGIDMAGEPLQYETMILEEKYLNALLFVPIGILAYFSFSPLWARVAFGPATSVSIEAIQWIMAAGNSTDTADVLANSFGHFVGICMAAAAMTLLTLRTKISKTQDH